MFNDNLNSVWSRFFDRRQRQLWDRFPGHYRAVVVETNDPLNMYRVRFKCPELHDHDLKPEECPWAVCMHDLGGRRAGRWSHPCIDDWVWISFEKGHPYGPVWTGFADPTRRKLYAYPQIFNKSPLAVNEKGDPDEVPDDFDEDYLPKDGRPMSHGWQDRYGNMDISRSIGFFPEEHKEAPPDADFDAISKNEFEQRKEAPVKNDPDAKYMVRVSKYGHILLQGDQGYDWQEEFKGSFVDDEQFEIDRWKYIQKLLNEDEPKETDQRRMMMWTRYGHYWEMRDIGWSKTRQGEYSDEVFDIGTKDDIDQRWIKWRTKGGMLFQACDIGFDKEEDNRVKKLLLDEVGVKSEQEDEFWSEKDARWIRFVSRYGYKIVIDDRGSHTKEAEVRTVPRGNGILLKGRRPGSSQGHQLSDSVEGGAIGFWWEFNENDEANWTSWGSPLGQVAFINDKIQYIMLCSRLSNFGRPFRGLEENEFLLNSPTQNGAETSTHHLKIDLDNEYIRLKTRANKGSPPFLPPNDGCHSPPPSPIPINPVELEQSDQNQGLEARDGMKGDGPWVEIVDAKDRGLWFSSKFNITALRAMKDKKISISFDDEKNEMLLLNEAMDEEEMTPGRIQIRCLGDIEIISKQNIKFKASQNIEFEADNSICMKGGGTSLVVNSTLVGTSGPIHATEGNMRFPGVEPGGGAGQSSPQMCDITAPEEIMHEKLKPEDRGQTYNSQYDTPVNQSQIEHPFSFRDPCVDDGRPAEN